MVEEDSITRQKSWSNLAELSAFLSLIHQKIFMYFEQEGIAGRMTLMISQSLDFCQ